jgi:ketosteroid isomerase-like protein
MQRFAQSKKRELHSSCSFVSFVVGLCFLVAGCAGEPKHPTWKSATGAEQHERLLWQAIQQKDWDNVERHLSPTFIGVNSGGQMFDRAGWLQYWKSVGVREFSLEEMSLQPEGADMKVAYILHLQGAVNKDSAPAVGLRVVSVWQQMKTGWMLTATSITPIQNN